MRGIVSGRPGKGWVPPKSVIQYPQRRLKMLRRLWMRGVPLAMLMIAGGCVTDGKGIDPSTLMASGKPAVCLSLEQIKPSRGKLGGASVDEVKAVLDRDRPLERVRNLVGDTSQTLTQVDRNNAALLALCGH